MAAGSLDILVYRVRALVALPESTQPSDAQLLEQFANTHDGNALEVLMRRHGRLVLGVCRRVLGPGPDQDDVFQATFMVLARKARSIRCQASVSSWLYGVAYRLARDLKAKLVRRAGHERGHGGLENIAMAKPMHSNPAEQASMRELAAIMDAEVQRLPAKNREALLLCHLEGLSAADAAKQLDCPIPTLKSRLEKGRALIRQRLARRGITLSAASLALVFSEQAARAAVPAKVAHAALQGAVAFAGKSSTAVVSAQAVALAKGVLKTMIIAKLSVAMVAVVMTGTLGLAAAMMPGWTSSPVPQKDELIQTVAAPLQPEAKKQPVKGRVDVLGDPLPEGALARLGTLRFRHAGPVNCSVFSLDGKTIFTASNDCTIRQWDIATGKELQRFIGNDRAIHQLALSPDGTRLASANGLLGGDSSERLRVWDTKTAKELVVFAGLKARVEGLAWSPNNNVLAARCRDGTVHLLDGSKKLELREFALHTARTTGSNYHTTGSIAFSPDGKKLASCASEDQIHVVDLMNSDKVQLLRGKEKAFHFVAFAPDGKTLISGGDFHVGKDDRGIAWPFVNSIAVWDVETAKRLRDFEVGSIADASQLATDMQRLNIFRRDLFKVPTAPSWTLSSDGKTLAIGRWDRGVELWALDSGKPLRVLSG
ncbi:MAG TPA: sigma-70 family RNA polymerase sigma factor, partial [Gemmataceae bacterium]|nr:sigma-70 family RNA polymerase sigma factor [Gemmataceae bacterium]